MRTRSQHPINRPRRAEPIPQIVPISGSRKVRLLGSVLMNADRNSVSTREHLPPDAMSASRPEEVPR